MAETLADPYFPDSGSLLPLVGRAAEFGALSAALGRAASGLGRVVILEGEAGIGRTRLVQELAAAAADAGCMVAPAAVDEMERRRPFGVLADALSITPDAGEDPDRSDLADLLYDTGPISVAGAVEFRIGEAIVEHLERRCARSPMLLVLEDLHWADPSTVTCLVRLARVCAQQPLLIVLTARPLPRSGELARVFDVLGDSGADRLVLQPLRSTELPALAEAVVGSPPGSNLRAQLSRAGGNPLLVIELLAVLAQDGAIDATRGVAEIDDTTTSAIPSLTILHRLSYLTPTTLDVLSLAAILGSTFSITDLCLLSGRNAAELAIPVREGLRAGALAEHGDRLAFRHALIRDALYSDLPAPVRTALHRDHARALATAGYPPGRVAEHLLLGAQRGDREAVEWLRRAAEEAGRRAPAIAVELLDHAIALADPADPVGGTLAADRAIALLHSGHPAEGEASCQEVLARRDDPAREGTLRWLLMRSMLVRGRVMESLTQIDAALALRTASAVEHALYVGWAAFARLRLGQLDLALELAEEAIDLAEPTGDALAAAETLHAKAQVLAFRGDLVRSAELGVRAVRALEADPSARGPQTATATAGLMLIATDRVAEGQQMLARGSKLNESLGAPAALALHHTARADGLFLIGEWDDAAAEIAAGLSLLGDDPAWPAMSHGVLALIAVHRDEPADAHAHLAAASAAAQAGAEQMREHRLVLARALLAEAAGRDRQAIDELVGGWDRFTAAGHRVACPELGPELVRRLVASGEHARAAEITRTVENCARDNPGVPNVEGAALLCRGLTDHSPGLLVDAVSAYRRSAHALGRALTCEDAAVRLAEAGDGEQARALLDEAHDLHQQIGAHRDAARTAAALRRFGVRRGPRATRARARTGWAALTPTERRVAGLVAESLSNPEIAARMYLSRRTVETHVSHALAKLGLRSRVDIAAEATRNATSPAPHG